MFREMVEIIDWLNSFIFVIADNAQYRYETQQYHTNIKIKWF